MEHEDSHEDYIMWLKILDRYGEACGINEPLLKYRMSSKGKSGSKLKSARMTMKVYRYMISASENHCCVFSAIRFMGSENIISGKMEGTYSWKRY